MQPHLRTHAAGAVASLLICLFALAHPSSASEVQFSVTEIVAPNGSPLTGYSLNDSGHVVGSMSVGTSRTARAFSYTSSAGFTDLGTVLGSTSTAYAINNNGEIVGGSSTSTINVTPSAVRFDGGARVVSSLGGRYSEAKDVNSLGTIVGTSQTRQGDIRGFVTAGGTAHSIGTLDGSFSNANAINNIGTITGSSGAADDEQEHAFVLDTSMHDIGTLGGGYSAGRDINDLGHVTGDSTPSPSDAPHAFFYDRAMHDLGTLGGFASEGLGINNSDQVVGDSFTANGNQHAFLYQHGSMLDLNSLINPGDPLLTYITLTQGAAINDRGQVLANGIDARTGKLEAFILTPLTPVPLPPSVLLLLSGVGCLLILGRIGRASARNRGLASP